MRKLYSLLFLLFFTQSIYAQVEKEFILLELGTSTWSNLCAQEFNLINDLKEQNLNIAYINYQLNDPFANDYANTRANYYNIQSVPYPLIAGDSVGFGAIENYTEAYFEDIGESSPFYLSSVASFIPDSLQLGIQLFKVGIFPDANLKLRIAITESNIEYDWLGNEVLHNVCRYMYPDANGISIDFSGNDNMTLDATLFYSNEWSPQDMELIVYLQNEDTKEILQTNLIPLGGVFPQPVHAFFAVEDTINCQFEEISFQNLSTGDVQSVEWYFEGGSPENSSLLEPSIIYEEAGIFDVRLIVSNTISEDTLTINDYIHIQEIPDVSFAELPMFCLNHPPYELTEGSPANGIYYGPFVDDGYFHPAEAGIGIHNLFFTYTDPETLCGDTLMQQAIVDLCEGISDETYIQDKFRAQFQNQHLQVFFTDDIIEENFDIRIYNLRGSLLQEGQITVHTREFEANITEKCVIISLIGNKNNYVLKTCQQ